MKKLEIDKNKCINCGTCALIYPNYFKIKDDGSIEDKKALVEDNELSEIIAVCPSNAIFEKKNNLKIKK